MPKNKRLKSSRALRISENAPYSHLCRYTMILPGDDAADSSKS